MGGRTGRLPARTIEPWWSAPGWAYDAAFLAGLGWGTIAFDISATAITAARRRFPQVPVDFRVADLLNPPPEWTGQFDLVLESYTTQALPVRLRPTVVSHISRFVADRGTLLILGHGREEGEEVDGPPWPLTRADVESYAGHGLTRSTSRNCGPPPDTWRWRAEFIRNPLTTCKVSRSKSADQTNPYVASVGKVGARCCLDD